MCVLLVSVFAGAIVGGVLGMQGADLDTITRICRVLGFILGIPVSYACFRFFVGTMIVNHIEADLHDVIQASLDQPATDTENIHCG